MRRFLGLLLGAGLWWGPTAAADFALVEEPTIFHGQQGRQRLSQYTVLVIARDYGNGWVAARPFDAYRHGRVKKDDLRLFEGTLTDAEAAQFMAVEALAKRDFDRATALLRVAENLAPEYGDYQRLRELVAKLSRSTRRFRSASRNFESGLSDAMRTVNNARAFASVETRDTFTAEQHQRRAERMVSEAREDLMQGQARLEAAAMRLATDLEALHQYALVSLGGGQVQLAFALEDATRALVRAYLPQVPYEGFSNSRQGLEARATCNRLQDLLDLAVREAESANYAAAARAIRAVHEFDPQNRRAAQLGQYLALQQQFLESKVGTVRRLVEAGHLERAQQAAAVLRRDAPGHPGLRQLQADIDHLVNERTRRLALAGKYEAQGDYVRAYELYTELGEQEATGRLVALYAAAMAGKGNYLAAARAFAAAGQGVQAEAMRSRAGEQLADYEKATRLAREGHLADALAIYDRYGDSAAAEKLRRQEARRLEVADDLADALAIWRQVGDRAEIARLERALAQQEAANEDALALEAAGRYAQALTMFTRQFGAPDEKRVARHLAIQRERDARIPAAIAYYDLAGQATDAQRLREKHPELAAAVTVKADDMDAEDVFQACAPGTVTVLVRGRDGAGHGSGFFVTRDGHVLTNNHVVEGAESLQVRLRSGQTLPARLVAVDAARDLALLQIDRRDTPALPLGRPAANKVGATVYAIGTPQRLEFAHSITQGIIGGFRELNGVRTIQISVLINQGNSGGPLLNRAGEVIGISTFKYVGRGDVEGLNFAVSIDEARDLLRKAR